jgi:phage-related protein
VALTIGELVGYLRLDSKAFESGLLKAKAALKSAGDSTEKFGGKISGVAGSVRSAAIGIGTATLRFGVMAGAMSIAGSAASALVAGLITASGALGLLPAAGLAGASALVALKVGMSGFGDALKNIDDPAKFAQSLDKLAPSARDTAVAVRELAPAWREVQQSVQQELFSEMGSVVRQLGSAYLPILRSGLTDVASSFGVAAAGVAGFLRESQTMTDARTIFASTSTVVSDLANAVGPLLDAFRDVAAVAADFLPALSFGAGDAAQKFATFIGQARQTGQLAQWMSNGLSAVGDLLTLLRNVVGIIGTILSTANSFGTTTFAMLVKASDAASKFVQSAAGTQALREIFGGIAAAGAGLQPVLVEVGRVLVEDVAPAVARLGPVVGQAVAALAGAVGPLGQILAAVVPLAGILAQQLAEHLVGAIQQLTPLVVQLAGFLSAHPALLTAIAAAAGAAAVGFGPLSGLLGGLSSAFGVVSKLVGPISELEGGLGGLGRVFGLLTGPVGIVLGLLVTLYASNEQFRDAVNRLLGVLGSLVGTVLKGLSPVLDAAGKLLAAVATAAAPLVDLIGNLLAKALNFATDRLGGLLGAFQPFTFMITNVAVPILVTLLDIVTKVFQDGIGPIIDGALKIVTGIIQTALALIRGDWSGAWAGVQEILAGAGQLIVGVVRGTIDLVVGIFRDLAATLRSVLAGAGAWLVDTGRNIVQGLVNGIGAVGGWIKDKIMSFVQSAWSAVKSFFGINSPSRLMMGAGVNIGQGLIIGVQRMSSKFDRAFLDMATPPPVPSATIPAPRLSTPAGLDYGSSYGLTGVRSGRAAAVVHVTNHYPQAKPTSTTVNKGLQYAAALGWG